MIGREGERDLGVLREETAVGNEVDILSTDLFTRIGWI